MANANDRTGVRICISHPVKRIWISQPVMLKVLIIFDGAMLMVAHHLGWI